METIRDGNATRKSASIHALIALGTNKPHENLSGSALFEAALRRLSTTCGIVIAKVSSVWATPAWPDPTQPIYANAAAELQCVDVELEQLAETLFELERVFGRTRSSDRWAPRTLDLDIIAFGDFEGEDNGIIIPHPRARERAFVLAPLAEIAPDWRAKPEDAPAATRWRQLPGADEVQLIGPLNIAPKR